MNPREKQLDSDSKPSYMTLIGTVPDTVNQTTPLVTVGPTDLAFDAGNDLLINPHIDAGLLLEFKINAGDDSVERTTGSFLDAGFTAGMTIHVANTTLNDGTYLLSGVTDLVMTIDSSQSFSDEGPIDTPTISTMAIKVGTGGAGFYEVETALETKAPADGLSEVLKVELYLNGSAAMAPATRSSMSPVTAGWMQVRSMPIPIELDDGDFLDVRLAHLGLVKTGALTISGADFTSYLRAVRTKAPTPPA